MKNQNKESCPIFIITLEHAIKRRDIISERLCELQLPFEFINGVDGRTIDLLSHPDYKPIKRRLFYGRDLSSGEFGCVLAHRNVYEHLVKNKIPRALVLEDDAILTNDLPTAIDALCRIPDCWDIVRFLGREKNYCSSRKIMPLNGIGVSLSRPHGIPGGAYGYILNLKAAKRLLDMMQKNWLAIDTLHGLTWLTGIRTFSVTPSPVLPNDGVPSCIDEQDDHNRWNKSVRLPTWQRLFYPLTRGLWKFHINTANKMVWVSTWPADKRLRQRYNSNE